MRKKRKQVDQPVVPEGWVWVRLFVKLRGGHYHHEWEIARVVDGKVQLWGFQSSIPITAPILQNALWRGPVQPPPLEEPLPDSR